MNGLKKQFILLISVTTLILLVLHAVVIYFFLSAIQEIVFQYLFWNYLSFFFFSIIFTVTLVKVKNDFSENFGYIILALMTLKTALSYGLFEFFVMESPKELLVYKYNFLILFVCYLIIDVLVALKLLNNLE